MKEPKEPVQLELGLEKPLLVTVDEARRLCGGESRSSFYRALRNGELEGFKRGRRTLISLASIRRRLNSLPKATVTQATVPSTLSRVQGGRNNG
jgi:hypothetical protein